jgi:hypothetical protein
MLNIIFYALLGFTAMYVILAFFVSSIEASGKNRRLLSWLSTVGGKLSVAYLLVLIIPSSQLIFDQLMCHIGDTGPKQEKCFEGQSLARFMFSIVFLLMVGITSWLLSNNLSLSIPFEENYLNRPLKSSWVEDLVYPALCALLHTTGNEAAKILNLYLLAAFGIYVLGTEIFKWSSFDRPIRVFMFRVKALFAWLFFSAALFFVGFGLHLVPGRRRRQCAASSLHHRGLAYLLRTDGLPAVGRRQPYAAAAA